MSSSVKVLRNRNPNNPQHPSDHHRRPLDSQKSDIGLLASFFFKIRVLVIPISIFDCHKQSIPLNCYILEFDRLPLSSSMCISQPCMLPWVEVQLPCPHSSNRSCYAIELTVMELPFRLSQTTIFLFLCNTILFPKIIPPIMSYRIFLRFLCIQDDIITYTNIIYKRNRLTICNQRIFPYDSCEQTPHTRLYSGQLLLI